MKPTNGTKVYQIIISVLLSLIAVGVAVGAGALRENNVKCTQNTSAIALTGSNSRVEDQRINGRIDTLQVQVLEQLKSINEKIK